MEHLAGMITTWLIRQEAIEANERELYEYASHSFYLAIAPFLYAFIIGGMLGELRVGFILVIPFAVIRKYSGGFHAKREWTCLISSCLLLCGCILIAARLQNSKAFGGVVLLGVIGLAIFSPIDSENRRLQTDEKKLRKRDTIVLALLFYFIYLALSLLRRDRYAVCIGVGILQTAGLQVPCVLQNMTKKIKNMSFHPKWVEK